MKVNNNTKGINQAATSNVSLDKTLGAKKNKDAQDLASALGSTKVDMSPQAQAFQKAKSIASNDSVDDAKVARLQKLIDEGKYKVDAQAIADRIVDEHLATGE